MATSQLVDIDKDLTTCPICFEQFTRPKHLPCLHSFCEGCLNTYITSAFEKDNSITGVNCPVCRGFVPKPEDVTWDNWAESMLVNHFLTSIIDASRVNKENITCDVCARENETESAVSWCFECREAFCASCDRQHRRFGSISNHRITRLTDLPSLGLESRLFATDIFCHKHTDKKLEAYCADHSAVCCLSCAMLEHRKCENVGTIEAAADEKRKSLKAESLEKSFSDMKSTLKNLEDKIIYNEQNFESSVVSIKSTIDSLFQEASRNLETSKNNAVEEVKAAEKVHLTEIQAHKDQIRCKISAAENDMMVLQLSLKVASDAQFLMHLNSLIEQKTAIENYIEEQKDILMEKSISFECNEALTKFSSAAKIFGTITVTEKLLSTRENANLAASETDDSANASTDMADPRDWLLTASPSLLREINVKSYLNGVVFMNDDRLWISSEVELTLLKLDGTILSSLKHDCFCGGLKLLGNDSGAVIPRNKNLQIFTIEQNSNTKCAKKEHIDVLDQRTDFAFRRGKYYIGGEEEIIVLDKDKNYEREISILQSVWYLDVRADGSVCYSSGTKDDDIVYCVSSDGEELFKYSHDKLRNVYGVTFDKSENIYACGRDSRNVHQLTPDGKLNRIILEDLPSGPVCISFNEDNDKAAVGCEDRLLLYQFS